MTESLAYLYRKAHSKYSMSAGYRWMNCAGSVALSAQMPERETSAAAVEGQEAHKMAEEILRSTIAGDTKKSEVPAIQFYVDYVLKLFNPAEDTLLLEKKISLDMIDTSLYGTADAVILKKETAHIIDFKFGKNYEVTDPTQAKLYALLFCYSKSSYTHVYIHYVQPRLEKDTVKVWKLSQEELITFAAEVKKAITMAERTAELNVGEWCLFCPARTQCPAQKGVIAEALDLIQTRPDIALLAPEKVRELVLGSSLIESYLRRLKEFLKKEVQLEEKYQLKLRKSSGGYEWQDIEKAIQQITDRRAYSLRTPKQLVDEKIVRFEDIQDNLTEKTRISFEAIT